MDGQRDEDVVLAGEAAREQFHDARGYGQPTPDGGVALDPVEAAHLLFRGDLDTVDGEGFDGFLASQPSDFGVRFLVYADLRSRGFYLTPARADRVADPAGADLIVHPRGSGPWEGEVAYRVVVVGERTNVPASDLGGVVLAVVDEEGEVTYFETDRPAMDGSTSFELHDVEARVLADRVVVHGPPSVLYSHGFFGQPLGEAGDVLQLSLVEAAYLAEQGALSVIDGGLEDITARGRAVEGDRFDRRLAVYSALRDSGVVPKTGFKFGADFRTYTDVDTVDDLGHSEHLIRVLPSVYEFTPRELALDVRLAHGVRKRMVFALTDGRHGVTWLSVGRLTP